MPEAMTKIFATAAGALYILSGTIAGRGARFDDLSLSSTIDKPPDKATRHCDAEHLIAKSAAKICRQVSRLLRPTYQVTTTGRMLMRRPENTAMLLAKSRQLIGQFTPKRDRCSSNGFLSVAGHDGRQRRVVTEAIHRIIAGFAMRAKEMSSLADFANYNTRLLTLH